MDENLPQYLERIKPSKKYFGTIEKQGTNWLIKAEPQVMEMVRRVFQATMEDEQGMAIIPCSKRINGDINWLMMRYPLKILSHEEWEAEMEITRNFALERQAINFGLKLESTPQDFFFKGTLLPFQETGVAFMYNNKRCLLADGLGLGKTIQSLALICKTAQFPILIVVPPHLIAQWQSEIEKFIGTDLKVHVIRGLKTYNLPDAQIYITHYLLLRGWQQELAGFEFDTVIFDEAQELRHSKPQKYRAASAISNNSKNVICLSGTPIYNYGIEMFNVMDIIEKGCLGSLKYFLKEWCDPIDQRVVMKPELLGNYLTEEGLMLRRRKEEVLKDLPPKLRAIQPVDLDNDLYISMMDKSIAAAKQIPLAEDKDKSILLMNAVNNLRRATGIAKAQHVAKFTEFLLEAGEPCLLFAHHHDVIDLYKKYLESYSPLCITGLESSAQKNANVKKFMDGETNLLIINLRTTAGLNLQRARCVIFGELDWSPSVHWQSEDRCHRIGQRDSVLAYYLVAQTDTDQEIMNCLGLKKEQFAGIMKDARETPKETELGQVVAQKFMWNVVQKLQERDEGLNR